MASSNRHWPSMFKSKPKPCNPHHHHWQHDITSSLISTACNRSPYPSAAGFEERSPEPKPRWNPKPEQIRILETIFNSGMVNPPRDEIRKIRAQLQEYGQVGDANVFYWFQNRKSRSKHKLRQQLQNSKNNYQNINPPEQQQQQQQQENTVSQLTAPSSSSSTSEKSPPKEIRPTKVFSSASDVVMVPNFPTTSVNHNYLPAPPPISEAFFFPMQHHGRGVLPNNNSTIPSSSQGFCFSDLSSVVQSQQPHGQHNVGPCTSLLLSEIMNHGAASSKNGQDQVQDKYVKLMHPYSHLSFCVTPTTEVNIATVMPPPITTTTTVTVPSPINFTQVQGIEDESVTPKSTVLINDVAFEVSVGPFNVRDAFGNDAMLIHSTGHPVPTNHFGVTLHSLHHGASYYLII
ncbi:hypothetical protein TanjilG_08050 [Lupinus angustifolius]|uniref:Homeobox domain-containing protein n=1 Tax=Lupinus angustifolius TaxID=3871 RepID=A0A4P1RMJ4_LUPAN|nr:PREDICTED: WUSCHEL-related homeobox 9-like [Lupinus angustifolius]OIW13708.1 hypothetical protein TanjilG_08050 [Lupinus angustifolius]